MKTLTFDCQTRVLNARNKKFVKQTCKIMTLVSGGEDVCLGKTVQQDCVDDQRAGNQEDQILVVRTRRVYSHHSLHRANDPLLHHDNVRPNGE